MGKELVIAGQQLGQWHGTQIFLAFSEIPVSTSSIISMSLLDKS